MSNSTNYYAILGVNRNATTKQILKSYKKLALQYHPDRNIGQSRFNTDKFHEILTAYEILKDQEKRAIYDQFGENGLKHNGLMPTNIEDLFDLIFADKNNTNHTNNTDVDFTVECQISVTLHDLYHGNKQTISSFKYPINCKKCQNEPRKGYKTTEVDCTRCYGKGQIYGGFGTQRGSTSYTVPCNHCDATGKMDNVKICSRCNGSGTCYKTKYNYEIQIPRGTQHGETIKILYEDKNEFLKGYVLVKTKCFKNNKYYVKLSNLYMNKPLEISLRNAFSGGEFIIDHFGDKLCIECSWDIIQTDEYHKIERKGLLRKGTQNSFGDLFVKFEIIMPNNLNQETILQIRNLLSNDATQQIKQPSNNLESVPLFELNDPWDQL